MTIRNPNCNLCGLGAGANYPCLTGRGNTKAKLMIVGQNPGYNEDQCGRPFIGRAGEYLDNSLAQYGIQRSECYVTNTVKCYTEGNRPPTKAEVKACVPYLWREIKALKPQYIMLLGNTALSAIGMSGVMKYRGRVIEKEGFSFYPTVHPAAVLRNPKNDTIFKQDVAYLANLLKGKDTTPQYDIQYVTDIDRIKQMCKEIDSSKMIAYDIESEDLDERQGRIWLMGVAVSPTRVWVLPVEHPDNRGADWVFKFYLKRMIEKINSKTRWRVAQNGKFDNRWLKHHIGIAPRMNWDTMLASHLLNENTPNDLEYLSQTMLGMPPYKGKITFSGDKLSSLKEMGDYCGEDCCNTYRIAQKQIPQVRDDTRLWKLYTKLIIPLSKTLEDVEAVGVYIDTDRLAERKQICEEKIKSFEDEMTSLVPDTLERPVKKYKTKEDVVLPWNFNSYQQVGKMLFNEKGFNLTPYSLTPTGEPCTDDESLTFLKDDAPEEAVKFIDTLSTYRTWRNKYLGTYISVWESKLQDSRVYTSFKIHGTVTGRLSGDFQQVPREKFIRSIISTPPGWSIVELDYSQLELRLIAFASGDPRMIRVYQTGGDIHTETASIVTHKAMSEITKEERFKSKAINFGGDFTGRSKTHSKRGNLTRQSRAA